MLLHPNFWHQIKVNDCGCLHRTFPLAMYTSILEPYTETFLNKGSEFLKKYK